MWLGNIAQFEDASGTAVSSQPVPVQNPAAVGTTVLLVVESNALSTADGNFAATDNATGGGAANVWTEIAHRFKSGTTQLSVLSSTLTRALTTSNSWTIAHAATGTPVAVAYWCVTAEAFDDLSGFDVMAVADGSSASAASGPTVAGAQTNELAFVATATGSNPTISPQAGWQSSPQVIAAGASTRNLLASWKYLTSGGTRSGAATLSTSSTWAQIIVVFKSAAPPQVLVPNADFVTTGWVQTGGTGGQFFTCVDDGTTPNTTDFLTSQSNPSSQVLELGLSPGSTPTDMTGHKLSTYARLNGSAGTLVQRLKQGSGTTVASSSSVALTPGVWAWYTFALTSTQAGTISDYTVLRHRDEVSATP